jgi:hypothetical protein
VIRNRETVVLALLRLKNDMASHAIDLTALPFRDQSLDEALST